MLDRAENLLHDHYGGKAYWDVSAAAGAPVRGAGDSRAQRLRAARGVGAPQGVWVSLPWVQASCGGSMPSFWSPGSLLSCGFVVRGTSPLRRKAVDLCACFTVQGGAPGAT